MYQLYQQGIKVVLVLIHTMIKKIFLFVLMGFVYTDNFSVLNGRTFYLFLSEQKAAV